MARSDSPGTINRVREYVHATAHVIVENQTIRVICSAGFTFLAPNDTTQSLTLRADRALYLAKSSGRTRSAELDPDQPGDMPGLIEAMG